MAIVLKIRVSSSPEGDRISPRRSSLARDFGYDRRQQKEKKMYFTLSSPA